MCFNFQIFQIEQSIHQKPPEFPIFCLPRPQKVDHFRLELAESAQIDYQKCQNALRIAKQVVPEFVHFGGEVCRIRRFYENQGYSSSIQFRSRINPNTKKDEDWIFLSSSENYRNSFSAGFASARKVSDK